MIEAWWMEFWGPNWGTATGIILATGCTVVGIGLTVFTAVLVADKWDRLFGEEDE